MTSPPPRPSPPPAPPPAQPAPEQSRSQPAPSRSERYPAQPAGDSETTPLAPLRSGGATPAGQPPADRPGVARYTATRQLQAPVPPPPGQYAPGQHAPGQHAPGQYAPGQYAPGRLSPPGQPPAYDHPPGTQATAYNQSPGHQATAFNQPPGTRPPGGPAPRDPDPSRNRFKLVAAAAIAVALVAASVLIFTGGSGDQGPIVAGPPEPEPAPAPTGCRYPAQILDLTAWNITVPTANDDGDEDGPKEVSQPELSTYVQRPWFTPNATCDGVTFRAPVTGETTDNSGYPRSELREMTSDGRKTAGWSSSSGTHTLVVDEAFTALPQGRPNVVGAQIHDGDDDVTVFRLEGDKLYVTKGDDSNYKLVTDGYVLGTRFEAKYVVARDTIQAFYNGQLVATIPARFDDAYFKAGVYTQANCKDKSVPCRSSNFGETTIYSVRVEHS